MNHSEDIKDLAAALAKAQGVELSNEWRIIPGLSQYAAHPAGLIFSARGRKPAFLKGMASGRGYLTLQLRADSGELERHYIHRIIATLFVQCDPSRPHVNHLDGNKHNNAASNLEWCTSAENLRHARTSGLNNLNGEHNPMAKYTAAQVAHIRALRAEGHPYSAIAKTIGCSIMQANRIARGLLRKDG